MSSLYRASEKMNISLSRRRPTISLGSFWFRRQPLENIFSSRPRTLCVSFPLDTKGEGRDNYLGTAAELIAQKLSPIFNVHYQPIQIRIERDKLTELIP